MGLRLVVADTGFQVHGVSYEGFPIILDDEMAPLEPATQFLLHACITNGRARSPLTWERYGQDLYDFFGFALAAYIADWKDPPRMGQVGLVEAYRDWALGECGNQESTVNHRLRTVRRFYEWCVRAGHLKVNPFEYTTVSVPNGSRFLEHVDGTGKAVRTTTVMLREVSKPIQVLSRSQCAESIKVLDRNPTHRLLFRLLLTTGLRSVEARTFPECYVFNPRTRPDLKGKAFVRLTLSPRHMTLKGRKSRSIDVPIGLMEDLYWWSIRERPRRIKQLDEGRRPSSLFVTEKGTRFSGDNIADIFRRLSDDVGFRVRPHLLRHTYATHTLHHLREIRWRGEPLLYLKKRLGHASLNTTMKYLHLLEELDADLIFKHEGEIDELFGLSGDVAP